jgi:quercetin dioxygenase-like cupin family protein
MKTDDLFNSKHFVLLDTVEYTDNCIISKTIVEKLTGTVNVVAFDSGQRSSGRTLPFDSFIQIIEGSAQMIVDSKSMTVEVGQAVIIPAHSRNSIIANVRFKMLATVIKSGYEEVSLH